MSLVLEICTTDNFFLLANRKEWLVSQTPTLKNGGDTTEPKAAPTYAADYAGYIRCT